MKISLTIFSILFIFITLASPSAARNLHVINFRSPNLYPESFAYDPQSQHFIVGGTRHQKLLSVSDAGVVETLISDADDLPANSSFSGLAVDRRHNRLLACVHRAPSPDSPTPFNALAAYDLKSRRRIFLTPLVDNDDQNPIASVTDAIDASAVANDVAADFSGNAYVTNSGDDFIWKVNIDGEASILSRSKVFKSHPVDVTVDYHKCGLNGIVYNSKGYLLVVQSNTGKMFKVDVDDGKARTVILNGNLTAADGLAVRRDGVVLVVSQHKLYFVKSHDSWGEGVVFDETALEGERFPTAVTVADQSRVYVLYGHVMEGIMGNADREEFSIVEVESEEENKADNVWLYVLIGLGLAYFSIWRLQMRKLVENMDKKRA